MPRKALTAAEAAAEKERAMSDKILAQAESARRSAIEKEVTAEVGKLRDDLATFFWTPTSLSGHTVLKVPG
jgi:predicted Holliday junction resolvase-like endonuclease